MILTSFQDLKFHEKQISRTFVPFLGNFINSQLENDGEIDTYQDLSVHCGDFIKQIKSNLSYTLNVSASKVEVFLLKFDSREAQNSTWLPPF